MIAMKMTTIRIQSLLQSSSSTHLAENKASEYPEAHLKDMKMIFGDRSISQHSFQLVFWPLKAMDDGRLKN